MNSTSIIYTYKTPSYNIYPKNTNQKYWIKKSISSARKIGYYIELYTDDLNFAKELDIDEVHHVNDNFKIWDSLKIYVLENRKDDNYFLSDSDIIHTKKIKFDSDVDIYFDGVETQNWDWVYSPTINYIKENNIFENIDLWNDERIPVYNVGILKINNNILKTEYIRYWKLLYKNIYPYLEKTDKSYTTPVLTQYLLTLLVNKSNYKFKYFTKNGGWPYNNEYYNHFPGFLKFKNTSII